MLETVSSYHFRETQVGEILDRHHIDIKRKHQNVRTAIISGCGRDKIIACSKELIATTLVHFESEEGAMNANPLRSFITLKRQHAYMIESLKDISGDLEQRRINRAMELLKFLLRGLANSLRCGNRGVAEA